MLDVILYYLYVEYKPAYYYLQENYVYRYTNFVDNFEQSIHQQKELL